MKIVTNSQSIDEPKNPDTCNVFALYKLFAYEAERKAMAERYRAGGMGWGEAKVALFEKLNTVIAPMREKYDSLMADPSQIDVILADGSARARKVAAGTIARLRDAVGVS